MTRETWPDYAVIFDTAVATDNLGDEIIMDAVRHVAEEVLTDTRVVTLPTHERLSHIGRRLALGARLAVVGGTNLLSSNMHAYNQWRINAVDTLYLHGAILLGVGWWQYQPPPNRYTTWLLRRVLSRNALHAVRDSFTREQLRAAGIDNVVVTGCPTTWSLDQAHCRSIPGVKGSAVVFTLTDYHKDPAQDRFLIEVLTSAYTKVYFWPQGLGDDIYLRALDVKGTIERIHPNLAAFDALLARAAGLDYVGTRLHAGIRALQARRRAIIVSIDNRAKEKGKTFGLPVIARGELQVRLRDSIAAEVPLSLRLPQAEIARWKGQFRHQGSNPAWQ